MLHKNIMVIIGLLCLHNGLFGWGTTKQYNNMPLNEAWAEIQRTAIKIPSKEVARRVGTETDVARSFKEEFLTKPDADAPISEKRKRQRCMVLVRKVRDNDKEGDVSELELEVNEFVEDVAIEFQNKEEDLEREIAGLFGKKIGYGTTFALGTILLGLALQTRDRDMKKIMVSVGGATFCGGGIGLYSVRGAEKILRIHQEQTKIMKNDWEASFKFRAN